MERKTIIKMIIGLSILGVLVLSATYAYFTVEVINNTGTQTITATLENVGSVVMRGKNNISLQLTRSQMMNMGEDVNYYGSSEGTKTVETSEIIGEASVEGEGVYSCDYTLKVNATGTNNMYTAFQAMATKSAGQIILTINGVRYDFDQSGMFPKTISGTIEGLTSDTPKQIGAQLKFVNKSTIDQSALAGTDINITMQMEEISCKISEMGDAGKYILATSPNNISEEIIGGMYRYQGTNSEVDNNYICFGTNDKTTCTGNTDAYMYRILGITPEGQLKLVKKEALNTAYPWNEDDTKNITWAYSDIYNTINGSAYLNNTTYVSSSWLNKIEDTVWKYGELSDEVMLKYETQGYENPYDVYYLMENDFTNMIKAKIGLMKVHDVVYQLDKETFMSSMETNEALSSRWNELTINDSNVPDSDEWMMPNSGILFNSGTYAAMRLSSQFFSYGLVSIPYSVRPVFYLSSENTIIGGEGTISNPYLIG